MGWGRRDGLSWMQVAKAWVGHARLPDSFTRLSSDVGSFISLAFDLGQTYILQTKSNYGQHLPMIMCLASRSRQR